MLRRLLSVVVFLFIALTVARTEDAAKERLFVVSMEGPDKVTIVSMNADGTDRTTIKTGEGLALDPALSADGKRLGLLQLPQRGGEPRQQVCATNLAFGDADGKTLYVTACMDVYRIRLKVVGIRPGPQ